uniref:Prenylcysteine lyase domain-containing protein n=1 Tax=Rhizophora mucronata TaxID=61149 RepID=A0A2P2J4M1_RHIMU
MFPPSPAKPKLFPLLTLLLLLSPSLLTSQLEPPSLPTICVVGAGIAGSSFAHFVRHYFHPDPSSAARIIMFERNPVVGGRMATVTIAGETFEAGASILHPKNYYAGNFTELLHLKRKLPPSSESSLSLGIWDGEKFSLKTLTVESKIPLVQKIVSFANSVYILLRYGFSLLRMQSFVEITVNKFLKYYESFETRPIFKTVDEMLKWAGLYDLTTQTLRDELVGIALSPLLIEELVTVSTLWPINLGTFFSLVGIFDRIF